MDAAKAGKNLRPTIAQRIIVLAFNRFVTQSAGITSANFRSANIANPAKHTARDGEPSFSPRATDYAVMMNLHSGHWGNKAGMKENDGLAADVSPNGSSASTTTFSLRKAVA
jgi:hypothetical protein